MDEDEELYRLMNEEDDLYMGDRSEEDNKKTSNIGCIGILLFMLIAGGVFICLIIGLLCSDTLFLDKFHN